MEAVCEGCGKVKLAGILGGFFNFFHLGKGFSYVYYVTRILLAPSFSRLVFLSL